MIERFEKGELPTEKEWQEYIEELRKNTIQSTKEEVKKALISSVEKRIPKEKFGLFLSGGLDSSLLALILKKFTDNFVCYSVGTKDSHDLKGAEIAAKKFRLNWKHKAYEQDEIEKIAQKTAKMYDKPDVINVGVGSVIVAATELAEDDKVKIFFGGLGSEEIFAGYQRHVHSNNVTDECWKGLKGMWQRDLVRDARLGKKLGISVKVPFLDENLIKHAMGIPGDKKITNNHKKFILREIGEELGLPHELAWGHRRAAQYGSGFDKMLEKIAKKKAMTKSKYVETLKIQQES